jgi:hypothetical protein
VTSEVSRLNTMPLGMIEDAEINDAVAALANTPETARRVGRRVRAVVAWVRAGMPLPLTTNGNGTEHQPAMQIDHLPGFIAELAARDSVPTRALEFLVLTASRTNSVIGAWQYLDCPGITHEERQAISCAPI